MVKVYKSSSSTFSNESESQEFVEEYDMEQLLSMEIDSFDLVSEVIFP